MASANSGKSRKPLYPRGWGSGNVAYVGTFRAFSMAVLGRSSLEIGDKIIMPTAALQSINRLRLPFPLLFEVRKFGKASSSQVSQSEVLNQYKRRIEDIYRSTNPTKLKNVDKWLRKYKADPHELYAKICKTYGLRPKPKIACDASKKTKGKRKSSSVAAQKSSGKQYCSVYEFSSPQPDSAYLPHWMLQNLGVEEGDKVELQSQFNIPKGNFCRLQPFKQEFMDKVSTIGYKSTLEHSLRHYSVLSLNQRIVVEFNHFPYECIVRELKPANAISILGSTDLEIEFDEPLEKDINHTGNYDEKTEDSAEPDFNAEPSVEDTDAQQEEKKENGISEEVEASDGDSSSLGIDDSEVCYTPNGVIDGALLNKLGVPLDYNEQQQLATMIIENRKLTQENQSRFDDADNSNLVANGNGDDEDGDAEDQTASSGQTTQQTQAEEDAKRGPDDVQCKNCQRWISAMSIMMHEMHCVRKNTLCEVCGACILVADKATHMRDMHEEMTCICTAVLVGKIAYDKHCAVECPLRLVTCEFCDKDNIPAKDLAEHVEVCKMEEIECPQCGKSYLRKDRALHDCGVECALCGEHVATRDKLLHMLRDCKNRRAICSYCGVLRSCDDMEEHRDFCGSRSEQCEECGEFVSLMNMQAHIKSNCQWFNNNQLSVKNKKKKKGKAKNAKQSNGVDMEAEEEALTNPYLDQGLLTDEIFTAAEAGDAKDSLYGLLKSNAAPTMLDAGIPDAPPTDKQLCPWCDCEVFMSQEEFEMHLAVAHPEKIDESLTQTVMAAFANPDLLRADPIKGKPAKKRKLSESGAKSKRRKKSDAGASKKAGTAKTAWSCSVCTFANTRLSRKCKMCQTPRV